METLTLASAPRLIAKNQAIQNLQKTIRESQKEINLLIKEIQKNCLHPEFDEIREEETVKNFWNKKKLLSKSCKDCGYSPSKPEGMSWQICEICWSTMKDVGTFLHGEDREHHYQCSNDKCCHKTYHT